jgi:hypothetical protein
MPFRFSMQEVHQVRIPTFWNYHMLEELVADALVRETCATQRVRETRVTVLE